MDRDISLPTPPRSETPEYRALLASELRRRKSTNPRYSLRGFARQLGISKTALSDVLTGKRHLSSPAALRVAEKLSFAPAQTRKMLREIGADDRKLLESHLREIDDDVFNLISDSHHYAILCLAELPSIAACPKQIARRLRIPPSKAAEAMTRLGRLGFLGIADGKLRRMTRGLTTGADLPSAALRKHHRQTLALAEASLESDPVESRDVSSITMAIDSRKLGQAKQMIREFRRSLCAFLESGEPDQVYTLAVQLFPRAYPISQESQ